MTLQEKMKSLKSRRANLIGRAKAETKKLEAQFKLEVAQGKGDLTRRITSYTGRYYAQVGPLLKQAAEIQNAINLLQ